MKLQVSELQNLSNEIGKELISHNLSPEIINEVVSEVDSMLAQHLGMGITEIELSTIIIILLKENIKRFE